MSSITAITNETSVLNKHPELPRPVSMVTKSSPKKETEPESKRTTPRRTSFNNASTKLKLPAFIPRESSSMASKKKKVSPPSKSLQKFKKSQSSSSIPISFKFFPQLHTNSTTTTTTTTSSISSSSSGSGNSSSVTSLTTNSNSSSFSLPSSTATTTTVTTSTSKTSLKKRIFVSMEASSSSLSPSPSTSSSSTTSTTSSPSSSPTPSSTPSTSKSKLTSSIPYTKLSSSLSSTLPPSGSSWPSTHYPASRSLEPKLHFKFISNTNPSSEKKSSLPSPSAPITTSAVVATNLATAMTKSSSSSTLSSSSSTSSLSSVSLSSTPSPLNMLVTIPLKRLASSTLATLPSTSTTSTSTPSNRKRLKTLPISPPKSTRSSTPPPSLPSTTKETEKLTKSKTNGVHIPFKPPTISSTTRRTTESKPPRVNQDFCDACRGLGSLLCCESCPKSFHLLCLDPPLDYGEAPEGSWHCRTCSRKNRGSAPTLIPPRSNDALPKKIKFAFESMFQHVEKFNPTCFHLPNYIIHSFDGLTSNMDGEFELTTNSRSVKRRNGKVEPRDLFRIFLPNGSPILCYACGGSALHSRPILSCDFCNLHFHMDCLDPPLVTAPNHHQKWKCPCHADWTLPQFKSTKKEKKYYRHGTMVMLPPDLDQLTEEQSLDAFFKKIHAELHPTTTDLQKRSSLSFALLHFQGHFHRLAKSQLSETPDAPPPPPPPSNLDVVILKVPSSKEPVNEDNPIYTTSESKKTASTPTQSQAVENSFYTAYMKNKAYRRVTI